MTPKQLATAANRINTRLRRARERFPYSVYVNEMERRIVMMTTGYDNLITHDKNGQIQLSRSKAAWSAVPTALAEAITEEVLAVGNLFVAVDKAKELLSQMPDKSKPIKDSHGNIVDYMPVQDSEENIRAIMEMRFNDEVTESKFWELAYSMRTQNQKLYDLFSEMYGKSMSDWEHSFDEYTDRLFGAILDPGPEPTTPLPSSYGLNQRTEERSNAARAIGRALGDPKLRNDPEALARLFAQYGQADFGTTVNGVYTPADYTQLTPDQIRGILTRFLK